MSKIKSKDFLRRQHKLKLFKKKQAFIAKRADRLIEDTILHLEEQQRLQEDKTTSAVHTSVVPPTGA